MTEPDDYSDTIKPLVKRARVKDDELTLEDISEFLSDKDLDYDEVLQELERADIKVKESETVSSSPNTSQTSLQIYFQELSNIDLLEPEEEVELSKKIHDNRDKVESLCKEYGIEDEDKHESILKATDDEFIKDMLREEEITHQELGGFMQRLSGPKQKYLDAHSEMVESNLRLVITIAKKYQHCGLSLDDLINEGNMGLMKAVDRFDYKKGYRFSTYSAWWIRQSILRAISNKGRTIRLPVYMNDLIMKWTEKKEELKQRLDREPHMMEVADALNIDYEKAIHIKRHSQAPTSLEAPVGDEEDVELKELIESNDQEGTEQHVYREFLKKRLHQAIESELTDKEKFVFVRRYGIGDHEELTLEDVGNELELTRERIRQIQEKAVRKIRESEQGAKLKEFLSPE